MYGSTEGKVVDFQVICISIEDDLNSMLKVIQITRLNVNR